MRVVGRQETVLVPIQRSAWWRRRWWTRSSRRPASSLPLRTSGAHAAGSLTRLDWQSSAPCENCVGWIRPAACAPSEYGERIEPLQAFLCPSERVSKASAW